MNRSSLNARYCLIHISFFGITIALCGYVGVYLMGLGFSNSVIGITIAAGNIASILTQSMVSTFCDNHKEIPLQKIITLLAVLIIGFTVVLYLCGRASAVLLCVFLALYTSYQTMSPVVNSLAFAFERYGIEINFGLARGLGSASYATFSLLIGYIAEYYSYKYIPIFYIFFSICVILAVKSFHLPGNWKTSGCHESEIIVEKKTEHKEGLSFPAFIMKYKKFSLFALGTSAIYFTHIVINTYMLQIIKPIGGSESLMGIAVFISCGLELPAMVLFDPLCKKFGCRRMIFFSTICFFVKNVLTFHASSMLAFYISMFLQFGTYGLFFPGTVFYSQKVIPEEDAVKGQALVVMAYTISNIYANLVGGILLDYTGVKSLLLVGIGFTALGIVLCMVFMESFDEKTIKK